MSKYNEYARRLDKAFRDVVQEYNDLAATVAAAEQEVSRYSVVCDSVDAAMKAAAIAKLKAAKENLRCKSRKILEQFCTDADSLTMELKAVADDENCVNPKDVDSNAIELLKSGVMNGSDYAAMVKRYSGNRTMSRLIATYADEARKAAKNPVERQKISVAMVDAQKENVSVVDKFETLAYTAKTYCGRNNPASVNYVQAMQNQWNDADIQTELENF